MTRILLLLAIFSLLGCAPSTKNETQDSILSSLYAPELPKPAINEHIPFPSQVYDKAITYTFDDSLVAVYLEKLREAYTKWKEGGADSLVYKAEIKNTQKILKNCLDCVPDMMDERGYAKQTCQDFVKQHKILSSREAQELIAILHKPTYITFSPSYGKRCPFIAKYRDIAVFYQKDLPVGWVGFCYGCGDAAYIKPKNGIVMGNDKAEEIGGFFTAMGHQKHIHEYTIEKVCDASVEKLGTTISAYVDNEY